MNQFKETFKEEAYELLGNLEDLLMEMEEHPEDPETIAAVFRSIHTIKGSASMFDYNGISGFTHSVESILDGVREGSMNVSKELIDLTLLSRDHITNMLNAEEDVTPEFQLVSEDIISKLNTLAGIKTEPLVPVSPSQVEDKKQKDTVFNTFRINFKPSPEIFMSGTNPLLLLKELKDFGECHVISHTSDIPSLDKYDPLSSYIRWEIVLVSDRNTDDIKDVFIFLDPSSVVEVSVVADWHDILNPGSGKKLGEILMEKGLIKREDLENVLDSRKKVGEVLVENGLVSSSDIKSALEEQHITKSLKQTMSDKSTTSIRVKSEKLDYLVDSVGELVTAQARLSQLALQFKQSSLISLAEQIERLTSDLRDNAMSLRMVPMGTTFSRFKRLVRDLSSSLDKRIQLVTLGGDTELDKNVIEKLNDPLVHIIRNSIDHGIEAPEDREKSGKPPCGTITLEADYSGANVILKIIDDGKGLDKNAIIRKAVEKGIVGPDSQLSDEEIFKLIFMPGFSTAAKVTNVSGRGVGMDVVKRQIDSLGGIISIESEQGMGTTFSLNLPLTLAIIEGLLVSISGEMYVFPLSSVQACIELTSREREDHGKKRMIEYRGSLIPYIRLREMFLDDSELPEREHIVIVQAENSLAGLVVDEVIGDHQTVIKNMGKLYKGLSYITGATILGDGSVAIILDVNRISALARKESL
ncbi:MAG: hypothetical protein B6241_05480 [Spirochaetaceae bacterium 4572_59]|nr:MAG: hypothetical protein B6241_05480 [Spirochaetaceae bacterium 4572_59]